MSARSRQLLIQCHLGRHWSRSAVQHRQDVLWAAASLLDRRFTARGDVLFEEEISEFEIASESALAAVLCWHWKRAARNWHQLHVRFCCFVRLQQMDSEKVSPLVGEGEFRHMLEYVWQRVNILCLVQLCSFGGA